MHPILAASTAPPRERADSVAVLGQIDLRLPDGPHQPRIELVLLLVDDLASGVTPNDLTERGMA
jgi:hypothetical protein